MSLKRIGVLAHPTRPQTAPVAHQIADLLRKRDIETWLFTEWDESVVHAELAGTDMVIAIGGDGAMLRVSRVCAPVGIPVLGLNMGYLGFLTEIKAPDWQTDLQTVLDGRFWIEERMMVHAEAWKDGQCMAVGNALNEFIIARGTVTRTIHLDLYIDGEWTATYTADAVIVSTATGSTAYALASGGPILPPNLRNILVVPVAPHLSLDRPLVLPEGANVEVVVSSQTTAETLLTGDGDVMATLNPGDSVRIQASNFVSRFVRLREHNYFYRSLLDRLEPRSSMPPASRRLPADGPNLP